ncbi:MAG: DUF4242 domain-containing protein [Sphingobium sp.]|nr:DUF4242 domain-containing protein [Sphingobium sp.]
MTDAVIIPLKRYMIERDIPGVGGMSVVELCGAARSSNRAIEKLQPAIQWQHSYVAGDKTYCIYLADSEETIRKHSEISGIPAGRITEIPQIIDPLTANN